jgi:hypothetical protein
MTLADIMQSVIQGSPDGPLVEGALRSLGGDEATPLAPLDREQRARLVTRLIDALRSLSFPDLARLEVQIMRAVHVMPRERRVVALHDAAASAALHKLVRYYSVCIGMDWARASALQAALTDFCAEVLGRGGLELTMAMTGLTQLTIEVTLDVGYELVALAIDHREPWTLALCDAAAVTAQPLPEGGLLSFVIDSEPRPRQLASSAG